MSDDPRLVEPQRAELDTSPPVDPLRLCVFATVALLGWLLGPMALLFFAVTGFLGYYRARRAGLMTSRCALGDTRLVLVYLAGLAVIAAAAVALSITGTYRIGWW